MSEWVEKRLEDMIQINHSNISENKYNGTIQYVDISSVDRGRLLGYTEYKYSEAPGRARRKIKPGDTIFSTVRPNLRAYWYVKDCPENAIVSTGFAVIRAKGEYNNRFIYYLLTENSFVNYLALVAKGSNYPAVDTNDFKNAKVTVPDSPTQNRIASILSTYDDAIENNNRRIALLEKAARELYQEWFVRLRFPGHESVRFVNGLSEGWEIKRLDEYCHITDGTHDTPQQTEYGIPLVTGSCINSGFIDFNSTYFISEADHMSIKRRSGLDSGDILFSNIGTVGNSCIVNYDREFSVKNVIIFKPKTIEKTAYLYYLLTSPIMQDIFTAQTSGASQQFVGLTFMRRFKILVPNKQLIDKFAQLVVPILNEKQTLNSKSQNLARQRDLLLPRLMSGKLEV
ncbi:MAG: restriction endonuclease subunit S [Oscillospiraceae bacterium]|nr:restriction endonuclease subunit S [Oscillospiraceae bacterium]